MKWIKTDIKDAGRAKRSQRNFMCLTGVSLSLFFAARTSAYPFERLSPAFHCVPAAKVAPSVPLSAPLRDSAMQMAALLYPRAVNDTATNIELTNYVNQAAGEMAAQLAPDGAITDSVYYDLFGDLGMFMHLVEQTVLLTAQKHNKFISSTTLLPGIQNILASLKGSQIYNTVAILTGRPILLNKPNSGPRVPRNPTYPHGPLDPNEMAGPIGFTDQTRGGGPTPDGKPRPPSACLALAPLAPFYPQPFIYTIRFANLKGANIGAATTITIKAYLDDTKLNLGTTRLGLITFENSLPNVDPIPGTNPALCFLTPTNAAIPVNGAQFPIPTMVAGASTPRVEVTFTKISTHIKQLTWTFHPCDLAPGSEGSVSFVVSPNDIAHHATAATIFNRGACVTFEGSGLTDYKHTNTWLAVPTP